MNPEEKEHILDMLLAKLEAGEKVDDREVSLLARQVAGLDRSSSSRDSESGEAPEHNSRGKEPLIKDPSIEKQAHIAESAVPNHGPGILRHDAGASQSGDVNPVIEFVPRTDGEGEFFLKDSVPDLTKGAPDRFPINAFPDQMRKIGLQVAEVYQLPTCLALMAELTIVAAAVGKSTHVVGAYKDKITHLNIYCIGIAERGTGKSVAGEVLAAPLIRRSDELAKARSEQSAANKAELGLLKKEALKAEREYGAAAESERVACLQNLAKLHERIAELEKQAHRQITLWEGDCTSEAMARALSDNDETLFCYSAEAGGPVRVALGRYRDGKSDLDLYLAGFSQDAVRVNRIGREPIQLLQPCLTLLWFIQRILGEELVESEESMERGFTARPLIFDSGARREYDDRGTKTFTMASEWAQLINSILDQRLKNAAPTALRCTSEAREVLARFNDEGVDLERNEFPDLAGELSRWRENAAKVAGLFALAEGKTEISADLASRATSVVRWAGFNYLGLLQEGRHRRMAKFSEAVDKILADYNGEISLGRLARSHGIKRTRLEALVAVFPGRYAIEERPQQPGVPGRPKLILTRSKAARLPSLVEKVEIVGRGKAAT